ncbi:hypothetical protein [Mycobacterium sp.]|uniref:hypothetical protein n=1 Tax=Mycobacterium sp. TaxID=1785 RepID=UPI0033415F02
MTSAYERDSDGPHLEVMAGVRTDHGDAPMRTRRADRKTDGVADLIDTDAHLCRV